MGGGRKVNAIFIFLGIRLRKILLHSTKGLRHLFDCYHLQIIGM